MAKKKKKKNMKKTKMGIFKVYYFASGTYPLNKICGVSTAPAARTYVFALMTKTSFSIRFWTLAPMIVPGSLTSLIHCH